MTDLSSAPAASVNQILNDYGVPCRIRVYTATIGAGSYDDQVAITQSGTDVWTQCLPFSSRPKWGSTDAVLMEQGKLLTSDKTVYFKSATNFSGTFVKVGIGSPTPVEHSILDTGIQGGDIQGHSVYHKAWLRILQGGSFHGE